MWYKRILILQAAFMYESTINTIYICNNYTSKPKMLSINLDEKMFVLRKSIN